jgi:hypothetical protein
LKSLSFKDERQEEIISMLDGYSILCLQEVFASPAQYFGARFCRQTRFREAASNPAFCACTALLTAAIAEEWGLVYSVASPLPSVRQLLKLNKLTDGGLLIVRSTLSHVCTFARSQVSWVQTLIEQAESLSDRRKQLHDFF